MLKTKHTTTVLSIKNNTRPIQYSYSKPPIPNNHLVCLNTHFNNVVSPYIITYALNTHTHISTFCLKGTLISALQLILKRTVVLTVGQVRSSLF